jgi:rsbT co-antagonist protein RsbR
MENIDRSLDTNTPVPPAGSELDERFFELSLDMLCVLDFSGHFKRLNPAWERTLGYTREELMARPFIEFVHPDDRERTLSQNKTVRGGGHARFFENRYVCKDGSFRWFLWNAAPDPERGVIYSVARDITDRKAAEEEREALLAELRAAPDVPANLLVLQAGPRRRELLAFGRGLSRRAHEHPAQSRDLSILLSGCRRRPVEAAANGVTAALERTQRARAVVVERPVTGNLKAAISWPLRTSKRSPTTTGWFHVFPSIAGNFGATSVNASGVALTSASSPSSDVTSSRS